MLVSISYDFLPQQRTVNTSVVMDHFGVGFESGRHIIADGLELPIRPGDVVLFTGPSGSGKSSLLRAVVEQLTNTDSGSGKALHELRPAFPSPRCALSPDPQIPSPESSASIITLDTLPLPALPLIDALSLGAEEALRILSLCGLGEARLLLRLPAELSDGQRYRFRLALAVSRRPRPAWIVADEFTATLDRTLARVIAWNVRRLTKGKGAGGEGSGNNDPIGFLLATTHDDIAPDLAPDVWVRCDFDGQIDVRRAEPTPPQTRDPQRNSPSGLRALPPALSPLFPPESQILNPESFPCRISFANELHITTGSQRDWPRFARWHYRSHKLSVVRFVTLLWHGDKQVGICIFTAPALSLAPRNRYFGLSGRWSRTALRALNRQLVTLSRVVLHPTYRGTGIAASFVRKSCEACPSPWIEALAEMGRVNPFFEKSGFTRVGTASGRHALTPDIPNSTAPAAARKSERSRPKLIPKAASLNRCTTFLTIASAAEKHTRHKRRARAAADLRPSHNK